MIFGSGRPSVNVDGHGVFSGSVVVVDVGFVDSDEVPLLRGMLKLVFCKYGAKYKTRSTTMEVRNILRWKASVKLCRASILSVAHVSDIEVEK